MDTWTLHCCMIVGIHLLLKQRPLFWGVAFHKILEPVEPQSQEHYRDYAALMLWDNVWLTVGVPVHPKGVQRVRGQSSVPVSPVLPQRIERSNSEMTLLVHRGPHQLEAGMGPPQTYWKSCEHATVYNAIVCCTEYTCFGKYSVYWIDWWQNWAD